jgi:hypothetical protein
MREIILRFEMNLKKITFSLTVQFIFVFEASTEVLSYWALDTLSLRDLQSTGRGLDPGVEM